MRAGEQAMAPTAAHVARTKILPSRRNAEPIDRASDTLRACLVSRESASPAEVQKGVPLSIVSTYALRER